jgi:hypothetical protein
MTLRSLLLAFAVLAVPVGAALAAEAPAAQSNSPEADASLYGQSVTLPRQAAVCAEHTPGYLPRFQALYDAWAKENALQIATGSKVIHEQAAKGGVDADAGMAKLAEADVERLRRIRPELLERHCELLLEAMTPPLPN